MQINLLTFIIILSVINLSGFKNFQIFTEAKICTKSILYSITVTKVQPFSRPVTAKRWNGQMYITWQNDTRQVTQIEWRTKMIETCCEGYTRYRSRCIPLCDEICENGKCTEPNVCTCNEGYLKFTNFRCVPYCENCKFGSCVAPKYCECYSNYEKDINGTCQPKCINDCINGYCAQPDFCMCFDGYKISSSAIHICEPICEPQCKNGKCLKPNYCECFEGYMKNDRNECIPYCENCENGNCISPGKCRCNEGYKNINGSCEPICDPLCSINSKCIQPNQCECNKGYERNNNETCIPICDDCENGTCIAPGICECLQGYEKDINNKCAPVCSDCDNGECISPGECRCHERYRRLLDMCLPICESRCINGYCSSPNNCSCLKGYEKLNDSDFVCKFICENENDFEYDQINDKCIRITHSTTESNFIDESDEIDQTTEMSLFCLTSDECPDNADCVQNRCICNEGFIFSDENFTNCIIDCERICKNGECNNEGECICYEGFILNDKTECVKNNSLSNCLNGIYDEELNECDCFEGYAFDFNMNPDMNRCFPICNGETNDGCINGVCIEPDVCECHNGFELNLENKFLCEKNELNSDDNVTSASIQEHSEEIVKKTKISSMTFWILIVFFLVIIVVASCSIIYVYKKRTDGKEYSVKDRESYAGVVKFSKTNDKVI